MRRRSFRPAAAGLLLGALGWPCLGVIAGFGLIAGCDQAPGLPADPGAPPTLSGFSVTPDAVRFEDAQSGDSARIELDIRFDVGGEVASVAFAVSPQFADACVVGSVPRPPVAEGVAEVGPGAVVFRPTFAVARDEVGLFDVTVAAFDAEGRRSNRGVTVVRLTADPLGPPALTDVILPATVALPASGNRQFTIAATVADPDGARDVARVEVELFGQTFPLTDDGESGDGEPCDGRFGLTLQLSAATDLSDLAGVQPVEIRVADRAGNVAAESREITFTAP